MATALIAFSAAVAQAEAEIKAFLKQRMYRHPRVMRVMGEAETDPVRPVRAVSEDAGDLPAGMAAAGGERRDRDGAGPADRQFHRRDDRPLRHDRASAAF